jgi:hypothetical protein
MADVAAAFCVGWSETLIGFPFLTCKVLSQTKAPIWGHPIKRYYQGVRYPLCSAVGFNMLVFPLKDRTYPYTESYVLSGALCGLAVAPQMYFIDTFTIRRQTDQKVSLNMFRGSKGFGMTAGREVVALSTYFSSYHYMRDNGHGTLLSGGVAGLVNWTLSFPLDTMRTRQIAQRCSVREAFRKGPLYNGFSFAASRAVLVNAISFSVYENVKSFVQS